MQLTRTLYVLCAGLSRHWSLTFCTLNSFKLCTHQWMCTSSYTQAFPFVLLLSWVCLYWFSSVQRRRCSGSTTYKVQPRRHEGVRQTWRALQLIARLCQCVKQACTGRQRLSLASVLLLPDRTRETVLLEFLSSRIASFPPFLSCPKTVFSFDSPKSLNPSLTRHCWYTSALFEISP